MIREQTSPSSASPPRGPASGSGASWRRRVGGFTILELLAAMLIVAIASGVAGNAIVGWFERRAHSVDVRAIISLLYRVRQSSIMQGEFNQVDIAMGIVSHSNVYGSTGVASTGSGALDLAETIQIYETGANMDASVTLFYTNHGRLLSNASSFRVCSSAIMGEQAITITVSSSGQLTSTRGGTAC